MTSGDPESTVTTVSLRIAPFIACQKSFLADFSGPYAVTHGAIESIKQACQLLVHSPFSCRKTRDSPFLRELIISFGGSGCVALFEIQDSEQVIIGVVRHQYESDYH